MEQTSMFDEPPEMVGTAKFSDCGQYRYSLSRVWDKRKKLACFIMLNPSTATAKENDPTIRRCIGFSKRWGYGRLVVVNLFAFRATDPTELKMAADPVGPDNSSAISAAAAFSDKVIAAWGVHGVLNGQTTKTKHLLSLLSKPIYCLGATKGGHPKHPLYLRNDTEPIIFLENF